MTVIGYLVSGPRDARQPERHLFRQATFHQPVAVTGQQESCQQDGQFSLHDTIQKFLVQVKLYAFLQNPTLFESIPYTLFSALNSVHAVL